MAFFNFPDTNVPISGARIPPLYSYGLTVELNATTPDSILDMHSGICSDRYDNIDMYIPDDISLNAGVVGINGLDTGVLANNTFYYVYVIGASNGFKQPAGLISALREDPILPEGYDSYRMVDIKVTDGTADFILSYTDGEYREKTFLYDTPVAAYGGAGTAGVWAELALTAIVPPHLSTAMVQFVASITPNAAGEILSLRPAGSASTGFTTMSGPVAAVISTGELNCFSRDSAGVAAIDYMTTAALDTIALAVKSFTYNI